jgi:glucose/arabinose dehydrogenase
MRKNSLALLIVISLSACQPAADSAAGPASAAKPSVPASAEQVSTTLPTEQGPVTLSTLASGLVNPWGMAFLPDGDLLVTERGGNLRRIKADGTVSAPLGGVPAVVAEGQGGLLDVALSPNFAEDSLVYLTFAEPGEGKLAGTAAARGRLQGDALVDVEVIFRQSPKLDSRHHFGSRLVFHGEHLYITMGDRGERPTAQDLSSHMGTIARIHPDGRVPEDNPFVDREGAQPETWSYGHRNQQGAALNPWTGVLWTHEHGPKGGDEVNVPEAGKNYGWPIITHGINYSGFPIPEAEGKSKDGMETPHYVWEVSPGVSGMAFYAHDRFPAWQRSLFVGSLAQRALIRLSLDQQSQVVGEERLLEAQGWRIRDVRVGPDGAVYALTDESDGRVLKLELQG